MLHAPPNVVAEIINGKLYVMTRPAPPYGSAKSSVPSWANYMFGRSGGGDGDGRRTLTEPELHPGKHVLVPDIGGWRLLRMPVLPKTAYFSVGSDWVCEVLSDSTRKSDLATWPPGPKRMIYAAHGVKFYWLVDPNSRTLEVLSQEDGTWSMVGAYAGDSEVRPPPFESCSLALNNF